MPDRGWLAPHPTLLVSGKVWHAQGQKLNRFEVRRKRGSERTKGEFGVERAR
jgi:hypothetical protein